MRILFALLQKEFIQIKRNKTILRLIIVLPVVQLLILVNAATLEMDNLRIAVYDDDHSSLSKRLTGELEASPFFKMTPSPASVESGIRQIDKGTSDFLLVIADGFEKGAIEGQKSRVQLLANAINSQQAQLGFAYLQQVAQRSMKNFTVELAGIKPEAKISTTSSFWYNPELNYKFFMVPGILVVLVSVVSMFLTSMNLVREKEMGTIEQINVTPVRKSTFIVAKLLPFLIIGLFELALGLLIGKLVYDLPVEGSLWLVFGIGTLYLIGLLGLGLLLSTFSSSQQQVTFVSYFFLLVFILMSGIFTSVDNMPDWGQKINLINPLFYFIDVMRSILLKGAGFVDLWRQVAGISFLAILLVTLAVFNFRKAS